MSKRFLYDAFGAVRRVIHVNDAVGAQAVLQTIEDVQPVIEAAKVARDNHRRRGAMTHVAKVPVTVVERAMREGWFHDDKAWDKFLNDPDHKGFRVDEGRL